VGDVKFKLCNGEEMLLKDVKHVPGLTRNLISLGLCSTHFKSKTRYTPYVNLESQISHIATNKGNIERQSSIYNVLSINDITLDSK